MIPAPAWRALLAIPGLRYGRSQARQSDPIGPAPDAHVDAVLPHLPPVVADMVRVQRLTGARRVSAWGLSHLIVMGHKTLNTAAWLDARA